MFKDKVVIVTGGANGIGRCIADEFRSQGAIVYVIDKQEGEHFVGDISKKEVLEAFAAEVLSKPNKVDIIINNALPLMKGICRVNPTRRDRVHSCSSRQAYRQGVGECRNTSFCSRITLGLRLAHTVTRGGDVND